MAAETKSGVVKPKHGDGSPKSKLDSSVKRKKTVSSREQHPSESKANSVFNTTAKPGVKSKTASSSSKATAATPKSKARREKKVYSLPGQKYDPPEEREPLRIFYESLSKQIPESEMAELWMMEHGLLSPERAKKAYEKKQRKQKQIRMGIPIKTSTVSSSKAESSGRQQQPSKGTGTKTKRKIMKDSDDNDDFILSHKIRKG